MYLSISIVIFDVRFPSKIVLIKIIKYIELVHNYKEYYIIGLFRAHRSKMTCIRVILK